ncbi:MAG: hypothetical protein RLZZ387_1751 [Chloroflexota bacterium]|jgi:hypothetical protein
MLDITALLRPRFLLAVALSLVLGTTAYGFAAANTIPTSGAGDGSATISGYTISSVTYALDSTDPSLLDSVSFNITPTGSNPQPVTVKIQLVTDGTWYTATAGSGTTWSVDLASANVTAASVNNLRVVAAQ